MRLFVCSICNQTLFFENVRCTRCEHALAYLPDAEVLSPVEVDPTNATPTGGLGGVFIARGAGVEGQRVRLCQNYVENAACNWGVPVEDNQPLCRACRLTEVIPNLSDPHAKDAWTRIERAKRRLLYSLLALGLPVESRRDHPESGVAFSFKQDLEGEKVYTGHRDGLITINVAEADDPFREKMRAQLGEAYRTLLGHFRHEIGHYYWDRLIKNSNHLEAFRTEFGDERASYEDALKRHYREGAPADWRMTYVSAYASMHPWEDWAETWAHYLHMVDTLETARAYGLALRPDRTSLTVTTRKLDLERFDDLLAGWIPLTLALNSLNRSMGMPDLYPFILSERAVRKLAFVHRVVDGARATAKAA